jgi:hypothetical protein
LLDPAHGIALAVEQAVDAAHERDVGRAIVAAVAGALERAQLREFRFPIAQDVLRDAEFGAELADGAERVR